MKKIHLTIAAAAIIASGLFTTACDDSKDAGNKEKTSAVKSEKKADKKDAKVLPNYRYVDIDTVLSKYNLAKDYNEEIVRLQTNMESQMKRHQTEIQNFATSMQKKMQNNGYLSEASYKQDEKSLAGMQEKAQKNMASLQSNFETSAMQAQQAVNDSIEAFVKEYNKTRGFDAILLKNATLYINPDLDITNEIVEGLNARYNKVNKK
ncbi:MAG: OmpH family outer membrane protein [Bacteroides sp.]|nr:OmpH family outer membrane protein [Bacteroides sp.]MDE7441026.1 OmpH family outer membrane protein [Muribaculaceae bacterium]